MQETEEQQLFFMRWAIQLGEKGRLVAPPNPWVGCVIVKDREILGEGHHAGPGTPHAEVEALQKAGILAKGATAYVSLEPCAHQGRTPPCVDALMTAGIKRVIIPQLDPDPNVAGKGVEALKNAGIEVIVGIGKQDAERSLQPYLYQRRTKTPFCVLKSAISLDGKSAAADSSSQWITDEEARRDVHLLRAQSQAILIGARTAIVDRPRLTVREVKGKQPLRVLFDPKGEVPPEGPLFDPALGPTLAFTPQKISGIETIEYVDLPHILTELGRRGILQLLVEGGAKTHTAFLEAGLAQRFVVYVGSCILGNEGKSFLDLSIPSIEKALRWKLEDVVRFGNDVRLTYDLTAI